ncbi:MAG: hypothetical protein WAX04_13230 [Oscillospiraceae bacterium]
MAIELVRVFLQINNNCVAYILLGLRMVMVTVFAIAYAKIIMQGGKKILVHFLIKQQ